MITNYRNPFPPLVTKEDLDRGRTEMRRLYMALGLVVFVFGLFITFKKYLRKRLYMCEKVRIFII